MGVDEDVVIDTRIEVDTSDLDATKKEIDKIISGFRQSRQDIEDNKKIKDRESIVSSIDKIIASINNTEASILKNGEKLRQLEDVMSSQRNEILEARRREARATEILIQREKELNNEIAKQAKASSLAGREQRAANQLSRGTKRTEALQQRISDLQNEKTQLTERQANLENTITGLKRQQLEVEQQLIQVKQADREAGNTGRSNEQKSLAEERSLITEKIRAANMEKKVSADSLADVQKKLHVQQQELTNILAERNARRQAHQEVANAAREEAEASKVIIAEKREQVASDRESVRLYQEAQRSLEGLEDFETVLEAEIKQVNTNLRGHSKALNDAVREGEKLVGVEQQVGEAAEKTGKVQASASKSAVANYRSQSAQIYYLVRSLNMLREIGQRISRGITKLTKYIGVAGGVAAKFIRIASAGLININKHLKKSNSETKKLNGNLGVGFKTVLKYVFGIRTLYTLANRLRSSGMDAMGQLAQEYSQVNKEMSSLLTSITWMRNSLATVLQPILAAIVPLVEKLATAFHNATIAIGSFIATLTGQKFVYSAIKVQQDYAASLDNSTDSAKKLKKELSGLDKLNVLHSQDDDAGGDQGAGDYFTQTEPIEAVSKAAETLKDILSKLFAPLKKAWDTEGQFVMDSFKYMLEQVWSLVRAIGQDFLIVWNQDATVKIFEDLLHILGDVFLTVGNIVGRFREAWNTNLNGRKILEGIRDLIGIITSKIREAADYTVLWSQKLDFKPLLQALGKLIEDLKKPLESVMNIVVYFYENVVLKFVQYLIESGFPRILNVLDRIVKKIDWNHLEKKMKELIDALEPFLEKVWEALALVFEDLGNAITKFINSEKFDQLVDTLIKWMDEADPAEMAVAIEKFVKALVGLKIASVIASGILSLGTAIGTFGAAIKNIQGFIALITGGEAATALTTTATAATTAATTTEAAAATMASAGAAAEGAAAATTTAATTASAAAGTASTAATTAGAAATTAAGAAAAAGSGLLIGGVMVAAAYSKTNDEIKTEYFNQVQATENYEESLWRAYNAGGAKNIEEIYGQGETMDGLLEKARERYGTDIEALQKYEDELNRVYEEGGNKAVSTIQGHQTTIQEAIDEENARLAEQPTNLWESLKQSDSLFDDWWNGLKGIIETDVDGAKEMMTTGGEDMVGGYKYGLDNGLVKYSLMDTIKGIFGGIIDWVKGKECLDEHSPSKTFDEIGANTIAGFQEGSEREGNVLLTTLGSFFDGIVKGAQDKMNDKTLNGNGSDFITGLQTGIDKIRPKLDDNTKKIWDNVVKVAGTVLSPNALISVGTQLIAGLVSGIVSKVNSAISTVKDSFQSIVSAAKSVFDIHSPSRVFMEIGEYITEGLVEGIDDGAENTEDAFEDMMPSATILDEFANSFTSTLARMSQDASNIVESMIDSINEQMTKLDDFERIVDLSNDISKLSNIEVPKIAAGFTVPANMEFTKQQDNSKIDLSKLPDMMKDAFIEALSETAETADDGDIIINLDGREVFKVVRNQNTRYKKQYGVSAFA